MDDIVKLRTKKGKIYTIKVEGCIDTHVQGVDKFGDHVKLPLDELDWMVPAPQEIDGVWLN